MKSVYSESEGVAFMSTAWFLSGWAPLSQKVALHLELPYSRYEEESFGSQDLVGNPYVGIVVGSVERKGEMVEAGVRLPVVNEDVSDNNPAAIVNGWATDVTRMEAFTPEMVSLRLRTGGYLVSNRQSGMTLRLMVGGQFWIPSVGEGSELLADVDVGLWRLQETSSIGVVFAAKSWLTGSGGSLAERSEFGLGLSGSLRFGRVEPGVHAHLPLGNEGLLGIGEYVDVVLGVHCTVYLSEHYGGRARRW